MRTAKQIGPLHALVALLVPAYLSACGAEGIDVAGISGSASMQIDVEVYKGPLSKELDVQKSELLSKLYESAVVVEELVGQTRLAMCALGCFDRRSGSKSHRLYTAEEADQESAFYSYKRPQVLAPDKKVLRHGDAKSFCGKRIYDIEIEMSADEKKHDFCPMLETMEFDLRAIRGRGDLLGLYQIKDVFTDKTAKHLEKTGKYSKCIKIGNGQFTCIVDEDLQLDFKKMEQMNEQKPREFLLGAANYAEFLRSRAAFVANQQTASAPESKRARRAIANFAQFLSDYGNQIGARADAILKQEELYKYDENQMGIDRRRMFARELLANTSYLRDSAPTGYLDLYKFNDASAVDTRREATDRIRLVEQLTADTYWTRINSVFAAGQGDVTMAFVKDDIGNWDLKKFDNRPGELVDAYKEAGLAVLQEVASAASGTGGVGQAGRLLNFADRLNFGGQAASSGQVNAQVERLRQRTTRRLEALRTTEQNRFATLTQQIEDAGNALAQTESEVAELMNSAEASMSEFDRATANSRQVREELAVLEGEKRGLQESSAGGNDEQRSTIQARITEVDRQMVIKQDELRVAEARAALLDQQDKLAQGALMTGNDRLRSLRTALEALNNRRTVLTAETVRLARQILDNYLTSLEELAEAGTPPPEAASGATN